MDYSIGKAQRKGSTRQTLNSLFYIALAQYPLAPYKSRELSSNTALYGEDWS